MPLTGGFSDALKDQDGDYDVAYVALFAIATAVFAAIPFLCLMTAIAFFKCEPIIQQGITPIICTFDPQPVGIAIGAVCTGFATALGALAGYMAATRNIRRVSTSSMTTETQTSEATK